VRAPLLLIPLALLLTAAPLRAQTALTEHTLQLDEGAAPAAAVLADLAWFAGVWVGDGLGGRIEEVWMPPSDGSMVAAFKSSGEDGVAFYEIVTMLEEEGSVVMRLKHFDADLTGWEEKDEVVSFRLVGLEKNTARFEGVTYRQETPDLMKVYVAVSRPEGMSEFEFTLRRVGATGPN
jgi:hypothetical protein